MIKILHVFLIDAFSLTLSQLVPKSSLLFAILTFLRYLPILKYVLLFIPPQKLTLLRDVFLDLCHMPKRQSQIYAHLQDKTRPLNAHTPRIIDSFSYSTTLIQLITMRMLGLFPIFRVFLHARVKNKLQIYQSETAAREILNDFLKNSTFLSLPKRTCINLPNYLTYSSHTHAFSCYLVSLFQSIRKRNIEKNRSQSFQNHNLHSFLFLSFVSLVIHHLFRGRFWLPMHNIIGAKMKDKTRDERQQFEQKVGVKFNEGTRSILGFLTNFKTKSYRDRLHDNQERMAVLCFFHSEDGELVKCLLPYKPYFYVGFAEGAEKEVQAYLQSKLEKVESIEVEEKVDLEEVNHLSGRRKEYLKVNFRTVRDLTNAKNPLKGLLDKRRKRQHQDDNLFYGTSKSRDAKEVTDFITSIRQYDVPFHSRVCIDTGLRAGKWFQVDLQDKIITSFRPASGQRGVPELKILSYDIETSKDPLKFPDAQKDEIMMISLMYEGEAFLIVNTGYCGQPVSQFDYQPKPEFACHVTVFNQPSEKDLLVRFSKFIQDYNPHIVTTYNGDKFDYPYIQRRMQLNFMKFTAELGISDQSGEFYGSHIAHLDCFCWVQRDAFLPQGSRGLKAVTKAKLNYDPIEVDPQDMVWLAKNQTQRLAEYSISDAVATYFLYMKHIHGFILALATIIPMFPDEVLRKGSGTLCENLLMAEAFQRGIIFPNKKLEDVDKYHKGNLLDSETYTGGKVECLRTGVYRADFPTDFNLDPHAFQELIEGVQEILRFAISIEMPEQQLQNAVNREQIKQEVIKRLQTLRDVRSPHKHETFPLIYHIDVAAMYPNIILTNRLQPVSIVNDQICSGCLFNQPQNKCKRQLEWQWRGTVFPLNEGQHLQIRQKISAKFETQGQQLQKAIKAEVKAYSQRIYKKTHIELTETRADIVCMRENSFYVDTVRAFRDRRYEYKHLAKAAQNKYKALSKTKDLLGTREAEGLMILYESMQLAHKIILNSFYGYVMRKGARWYSMEMAAMVTYLGSNIISDSKHYIQGRIGKPLELDTDGIWMLLPHGFPEDVKLTFKSGKSLKISYPCHILNHLIYDKYANDQYQWLQSEKQWRYGTRKQMTIFFQIDGPYKAMMIPAAKQKQKTTQLDIQQHNTQMLKKRYVVFNFNNKIKQFKGFQMKRRGQLRITKVFQQEIFPQYLMGATLEECYKHCATVAKKYLAIINRNGQAMDTHEILDYLQESRVLSRQINDYGDSKGVALSSARRLAQFLGPQVIKGKGGVCCYFVISRYPQDRPVAQRAIPTQIFDADIEVQREFLFRWTRDDSLKSGDVDIRKILDWNYYFERLSTQIQKMVCIPAVLQGIPNPVPEIELPEWLQKKTFDMKHHRQQKLTGFILNPKATPQRSDLSARKKDTNVVAIQSQHKNTSNSYSKQQQNEAIKLHKTNKFSMMRNFKSWLTEQKTLWRQRKTQNNTENFRGGQLKSILQIIPQKTSGNFNIWYWSGGRIQQLLLTAKRRYYTNGKGTKKAPREQGEVIEVVVDEEQFKKTQNYFDAFLGQKFYQTKMPLLTSLIINKGNLWKTNKQAMTYREEQVQEVYGEYLNGIERMPIPTVYLFHQKVLPGRTFWALIIPKYHEYFFIFVDKSKGAQNDQLLTIARKTLKNIQGSTGNEKISIQNINQDREAGNIINKKLETLVNQVKQKFMIVLSAESIEKVRELGVKYLQEQGPVLLLNQLYIQNPEILDWKRKALKSVLQSNCVVQQVDKLVGWSRYCQIPLCNLQKGAELLNNITNITLGRLLHKGDQITWWNDFNSDLTTTYESMAFTGKIITPGIFSSYCIEVAMENLAVNTIAIAQDLGLEDRETAGLVKKGNNNNNNTKWETLDEMTQVRKAFEYVRRMVKLWVRDFEQGQSYWANELLKHFHKWISSQSSSLYDPLLSRLVNELMKKVFHLLSRRLEQMGLHLVFANFNKLLIATRKHTPNEARNSVDYALRKCVQDNQKLFRYIGLTPCEDMYKVLVFKDQFNFMSLLDNEKYYYKLQIVDLMPSQNAKYFQLLLANFVQKIARLQDELSEQFGDNKMQLFLDFDKLLHDKVIKYLQEDFIDMLVNVIRKLQNEWEICRQQRLNQPTGEQQQTRNPQNSSQDQEQQENDSFIDDSEQQESAKKQQNQPTQTERMDIQWSDNNELDIFVENIFAFLSTQQSLRDILCVIRKTAIMELRLQPSLDYGVINPIYPKFQLPCSKCYLVNEQPGPCEHCFQQINCTKELERTVWKMMQQQGRDLYCDRCNRIKQDYLRKCGCGGKWVLKEFPLKWVPYSKKTDPAWNFVNEVFEFMGVA